ncbi:MAG: hypothetical protein IT359_18285 [Gemmatimonadaceae bacterium]|nr:hypothetical protein [Gemmatimonadaceae bacterium]
MRDVSFYVVPGAAEIPLADGHPVSGRWDDGANRIVLAGNAQLHGSLVRHEMLHALMRNGDHPREMFIGRCAAEVVCIDDCIVAGGRPPPPDPTAVHVPSDSLRVSVEVTPPQPQRAIMNGHFMMIIQARNETPQALIIDLAPSGDAGPPRSWGFKLVGNGGSQWYDLRADVPEVVRFAPFEVKRFIFDFRVHAGGAHYYDLAPGTYRFSGVFGENWAAAPPIVTLLP